MDHVYDEISAAHIVREVAEILAAEWVVPHVLNQRSSVRKRVCLAQIFIRRTRETLLQERQNPILPAQINDLFVGENRIGGTEWAQKQNNQKQKRSLHEASCVLPRPGLRCHEIHPATAIRLAQVVKMRSVRWLADFYFPSTSTTNESGKTDGRGCGCACVGAGGGPNCAVTV